MIKLYEQALEFTYDNVSKEIWNTDNFHAIVAGKFAELIVRECIEQLEIGKKCDPYTGELFICERNDDIDYEIAVLKEHFGVEE